MQNILKPGDHVKLISGSPSLTISNTGNGIAKCVWYNEARSKFEELRIPQHLLVKQSQNFSG